MIPVLWIVSPCYKDGDTVRSSVPVMTRKLQSLCGAGLIDEKSRILLVDDGSPDDTWEAVSELCEKNEAVCGIHIERNSGEEKAYLTGLSYASGYADVIITMDCDLQDDIELCETMLKHYSEGYDMVIGYRSDRSSDSVLYRNLAGGFYKVMNLLGSKMVPHASQFRLMSADAVKALLKIPAEHPFLPAMVPEIDLRSCKEPYKRKERIAGSSGYSYAKLFRLAFTVIFEYTHVLQIAGHSLSSGMILGGIVLSANGREKKDSAPFCGLAPLILSLGAAGAAELLISKTTKKKKNYTLPAIDKEKMK